MQLKLKYSYCCSKFKSNHSSTVIIWKHCASFCGCRSSTIPHTKLCCYNALKYSTALCITEYTSIQSSLFQCSPSLIANFLTGNNNGFQHLCHYLTSFVFKHTWTLPQKQESVELQWKLQAPNLKFYCPLWARIPARFEQPHARTICNITTL